MNGVIFIVIAIVVIIYFRSNSESKPTSDKRFNPTLKFGDLAIDTQNKLFRVRSVGLRVFSFYDVIKYELIEDGQSITSGGLSIGRALVGGALVSGVGAVLGGVTGNRKDRSVVKKMSINLTMRGEYSGRYEIPLIESKTKKNSKKYANALDQARDIISIFDIQIDELQN